MAKRVEGWGWGGGIPSWMDGGGGGGCGGVERLTEKSRTTTRINREDVNGRKDTGPSSWRGCVREQR